MLMRPNKAETAVPGCHCLGDMAVRMRKVLARPWVGVRVCHLLLLLIDMTAERAVMLVKKVTYFGEFGCLNNSCIRKSIILMFLRDKFTFLKQNSVTDVSVNFRPPCCCPSGCAPAWRPQTNLHKSA